MCFGVREAQKYGMTQVGRHPVLKQDYPYSTLHRIAPDGPTFSNGPTLSFVFLL